MQQELSTTNILSLFETSKAERASFVSDVIERLDNGFIDPAKVAGQISAMKDIVNAFTDRDKKTNKNFELAKKFNGIMVDHLQTNGGKISQNNYELSIKEVGYKFDYNHCGHVELLNKLALIRTLESEVKEMQDMLKKCKPEGMVIVDEPTGETYKVYPPIKSSTTTVSVTFK